MAGRWKRRMVAMAEANREAREAELRSMTLERAIRILEGLLSAPAAPPRRRRRHPVSLKHRMRRRRV
jgi:hypothetical protein